MSLVATTATTLALVEGALLKRLTTPYEPQRIPASVVSKAHTWSSNNETLYIISSDAIYAFSPSTTEFKLLFNSPQSLSLQPVVVARDNLTIIFAQESSIHVLGLGSNVPKITNTLIGHSSSIASLSLSNDGSLLASSSISGTLCVHNLIHNSLSVLKGLPASASSSGNVICMFHPHTRTRLLVGSGRTLLVYDTTRPSAPIKTIQLTEKENTSVTAYPGQIMAISCSPFSKALAAVAFNSGTIALIDLDKDRALLKILQIQVPVTSMTFTADGASLALGTENGKIILKEWRSSEDDSRIISVDNGNMGERVTALSIQRRLKHAPANPSVPKTLSAPKFSTTVSVPLAPYDLNHANGKSPNRRVTSSGRGNNSCPTVTPRNRKVVDKSQRAFSPPKALVAVADDESGDISVQIDTLMGDAGRATAKKPRSGPENNPLLKSRLSTSSSTSSVALNTAPAISQSRPSATLLGLPSSKTAVSLRAVSLKSTSKVASSSAKRSFVSPSTQPSPNNGKGRTLNSKTAHITDPSKPPSLQTISTIVNSHSTCRVSAVSTDNPSRTSTPERPSIDGQVPVWRSVNMGLATPDIDQWIQAGKEPLPVEVSDDKAKHVGWAVSSNSDTQGGFHDSEIDEDETTIPARHLPLSTIGSMTTPIRRPHIPPNSMQTLPPESSVREEGIILPEHLNQPQDFIRALVNDMVRDYQRDMREDIKGLHLDLLRMGRNWKHELRSLMDEYIGDLKDLREENTSLRKENDKLRRGF